MSYPNCGSAQLTQLIRDVLANTNKNTEQDVLILQNILDIANNVLDIIQNEDGILSLSEEVDNLAEAIAEGGVIVNRKIGANADVPFTAIENKVSFPIVINESLEQSVISFDINNDHILHTKGQYSINAQLYLRNNSGQNRTVRLNLYSKDLVTLAEVLIDTTEDVVLSANENVNVFPQFTYDKISDNDILIFVRQIGEIEVDIRNITNLHVNTVFTIAGSGIPTTTANIALKELLLEGIKEDEITVSEMLQNLKSVLIEHEVSNGNTIIKRNGTSIFSIDDNGHIVFTAFGLSKIRNVAPPTAGNDVVIKEFMEVAIKTNGADTELWANGSLFMTLSGAGSLFMSGARGIKNVLDPVALQDAMTLKYFQDNGAVVINGVIANGVLSVVGSSYIDAEIKKLSNHVMITFTAVNTAIINDVLFTIPLGFRPNTALGGKINLIGTTTDYSVTINADGTVVTHENIIAGTKTVTFSYNVI